MSHLTCSSSGVDIYFINGVGVGDDGFVSFSSSVTLAELAASKSELDNTPTVNFIPRHNRSSGLNKDIAEAMFQYLEGAKNKKIPTLIAAKLVFNFLSSKSYRIKKACAETLDPNEREVCDELMKIKTDKMNTFLYKDTGLFRKVIITSIKNKRKIVLVGHSQGTLFVNSLRNYIKKYYPAYDPYVSSLLVGAFKLSSHKRTIYYNFTKDGLIDEIASRWAIIPERNFVISSTCEPEAPDQGTGLNFNFSNHSFNCYTGNFSVSGPKFLLPKNGNFIARDYFNDLLKKAVSELANNDENCCNKEPGKLYRANADSPISNLFISQKTQSEKNAILVNTGESRICGASKISGRINIDNSTVTNATLEADPVNGIYLLNSTISSNVKLSRNIMVKNSTVKGGTYSGEHRQGYIYSEISDGTYEGSNNFSGYYTVKGSVKNSTIDGQSLIMPSHGNPHFTLFIDSLPGGAVRDGVTISGVGSLNATIGSGSTVLGTPLLRNTTCAGCGDWFGGVLTHNSNTEISGGESGASEVRGGVFLGKNVKIRNGSSVVGTSMRLDKGIPAIHLNTVVSSSTVTGGFYITSAQVTGSNVSGTPYVCTSTLSGATVNGNAVTCAGSYGGVYESNWKCNHYDYENPTTSFPSQCSIPDQTFIKANGSYTAMSEEDILNTASINQQINQKRAYEESAEIMNQFEI